MRFGKTYQQRGEEQNRLRKWHSFFAWYPVTVNGQTIWLERVERLLVEKTPYGNLWHYRFILP